ncbi:sulfotransferase family 2 domain-containing protein [Crocosphaera sp.]|uniref:sulfotransferase family 2 domain-containing protein n=1 Tax=Crocosphaera sp. TaxID=2729996 RepID=UPI00262DA2D3|nr:sulfotransferase family 2 domain-containing protein [Crocosphaera sp.]MDJ0578731.1 sulfotransferase family 2 domain-containing protein [Crocosphaera sp.]
MKSLMLKNIKSNFKNLARPAYEAYIKYLSSRYLIAGKYRRIYHYHIRKTGGTSLNSSFWELGGFDLQSKKQERRLIKKSLVFVHSVKPLIEEGNYFFAHSHHPAHQISLPPDTFTITMLRNPIKRVLSFYKYLTWTKENINNPNKYLEDPFIDSVFKETVFLGDNFDDFLDKIRKPYLLTHLYMFSPEYSIEEALEKILSCSAVCFTETMNSDMHSLSKKLELPLIEKRERRLVPNSVQIPDNLDKLKLLLEPELILFEKVKKELNKNI